MVRDASGYSVFTGIIVDFDETGVVLKEDDTPHFIAIDVIQLVKRIDKQTIAHSAKDGDQSTSLRGFSSAPIASKESLEHLTKEQNSDPFNAPTSKLPSTTIPTQEMDETFRVTLQFAKASLLRPAFPKPPLDYKFETHIEQAEYAKAKSKIDYALKVSELYRLSEVAKSLSTFVERHAPSSAFAEFAGHVATSAGLDEVAAANYKKAIAKQRDLPISASKSLSAAGDYASAISVIVKAIEKDTHASDEAFLLLNQCCFRLALVHQSLVDMLNNAALSRIHSKVRAAIALSLYARSPDSAGEFLRANVVPDNAMLRATSTFSNTTVQDAGYRVDLKESTGIGTITNYDPKTKRGLLYDASNRLLLKINADTSLDPQTSTALAATEGGSIDTNKLALRARYSCRRELNNPSEDGVVTSITYFDVPLKRAAPSPALTSGLPSKETSYGRAKHAEREGKFEVATRNFEEEIRQNGKQTESAIKDLANLHSRLGKADQALSVLRGHKDKLTNKKAYHNTCAQILMKAKRYKEAIGEYKSVLQLSKDAPLSERLIIERNIALTLAQAGELSESKKAFEAILVRSPNDETTRGLLERITEFLRTSMGGNFKSEAIANEFFERTKMGVSEFQNFFIKSCDFSALDQRARARKYFVTQDFSDVENEIKLIKAERKPKLRGELYLTLAAMASKSGAADDETRIHQYLSNFFINWAENAINERFNADSVRSLLREAISISDDKHIIERAVKLLVLSFSSKALELNEIFGMVNSSLNRILTDVELSNRAVISCIRIIHYAYTQNPSAHYLQQTLAVLKAHFSDLPLEAELQRSNSVSDIYWALVRRLQSKESGTFYHQIDLKQLKGELQAASDHLDLPLDVKKTQQLIQIVDTILRLIDEQDYTDKENYSRQIDSECRRIEDEINGSAHSKFEAGATHWLVEALLPLVQLLRKLTELHFAEFREKATSVLQVEDARRERYYPISDDGSVDLDLVVVADGTSPVEGIVLTVASANADKPTITSVNGSLRSQERKAVTIRIVLPQVERSAELASVKISAKFIERASNKEKRIDLPLIPIRLGGAIAFIEIDNKFRLGAGGKPVEDPSMFFGRTELIDDIYDTINNGSEGASFVVYGQQRSGKTSVLKQLKSKFADDCLTVELSLGGVDLSSLWQYTYYVQGRVKDALDDCGVSIDSLPSRSEVQEDPRGAFFELIKQAKRVLPIERFKRARIVLLIDEFTYIDSPSVSDGVRLDFLRFWKALLQANQFSAVIAAQNTWPALRRSFPNQLAVSKEVQISFLEPVQAQALMSDPIRYLGKSRFLGGTVERVFQLTGGSPYFIQQFCFELVRYMNARRDNFVSEAHLEYVVQKAMRELQWESFSSQFTMSDTDRADDLETRRYIGLLTKIATLEAGDPVAVSSVAGDNETRAAIEEGIRRMEIERHPTGKVSVRVGLFAEYLRQYGT